MLLRIILVIVALISTGLFAPACSTKIDERTVGRYVDESDSSGAFEIWPLGNCEAIESYSAMSPRRRAEGNTPDAAFGDCRVEGVTITMTINQLLSSQDFGYPEFKGKTAILTIVGDTLVTQSGRRFVKKGDH